MSDNPSQSDQSMQLRVGLKPKPMTAFPPVNVESGMHLRAASAATDICLCLCLSPSPLELPDKFLQVVGLSLDWLLYVGGVRVRTLMQWARSGPWWLRVLLLKLLGNSVHHSSEDLPSNAFPVCGPSMFARILIICCTGEIKETLRALPCQASSCLGNCLVWLQLSSCLKRYSLGLRSLRVSVFLVFARPERLTIELERALTEEGQDGPNPDAKRSIQFASCRMRWRKWKPPK